MPWELNTAIAKSKKVRDRGMTWLFLEVPCVKVSMSDSETPWTVAYQAPPSMGFSRHEYQSGLPFPSPGDLPNPGIEPGPPTLQADTLPSEPPGKPLNTHQEATPTQSLQTP